MSDGIFSGDIAANYDKTSVAMFEEAVLGPTVEFLSDLVGQDRALEFAIGTGRVALPLSARGVDVCGIEMSRSMVDQLMAKPGSERIPVTIGDMATTRVDGTFGLVYLVYNTISNLLTQQAQVECFRNAAAHLRPGGCFVVETSIPDLQRLPPGDVIRAHDVTGDHLGFDEYDIANQRLVSHHYWISDGRAQTFDSAHRYAWPAELDLMAQLAGMSLTQRWSNWHREPSPAAARRTSPSGSGRRSVGVRASDRGQHDAASYVMITVIASCTAGGQFSTRLEFGSSAVIAPEPRN